MNTYLSSAAVDLDYLDPSLVNTEEDTSVSYLENYKKYNKLHKDSGEVVDGEPIVNSIKLNTSVSTPEGPSTGTFSFSIIGAVIAALLVIIVIGIIAFKRRGS